MAEQQNPGIIITWADGTTSTYTIPESRKDEFEHAGGIVTFPAFPQGQTSGLISTYVMNFNQMRGYQKIGL